MDDDTRTDYTPTPEGKAWLDSLGPQIANIALARDRIAPDDETINFAMDVEILRTVREWSNKKPRNIMEAL
jgi:hypothetical protein